VELWQDSKARLILLANFFLVVGAGITFIAVPWLLIHQPNGERLFGIANAGLTLLIFLLLPYLGKAIDRNSRKKVLLSYFVFGAGTNLIVTLMILLTGRVEAWQLITVFSLGSLGASVYYPAQFAFNQEVLAKDLYKALSGAIEIQWQAGAMIAGGLAAVLIERVPLTAILLFDAGTYLIGFTLIAFIPYTTGEHLSKGSKSAWKMMLEGLTYLRNRPRLSLVIFASFLPFLGIMLINYLTPIFVKDVLQAGPAVYGIGDLVYSVGAVLAGLTIPRITDRIGLVPTFLLTIGAFTIATLLNPVVPVVAIFMITYLLQGWGNAGARVARSTLMLETIPNEIIGRVNLFFSALERLLRALFLAILTRQVASAGPKGGYWVIGGITLVGWFMILLSRNFRRIRIPGDPRIVSETVDVHTPQT
jgi:MFS family permease